MQYLDNLILRWVEKCIEISPSGPEAEEEQITLTADITTVTADSSITVDSTYTI